MHGNPHVFQQVSVAYEDEGASAVLTNKVLPFLQKEMAVETSGTVNVDQNGLYTIRYEAGKGKYHQEAERIIEVRDYHTPEITLTVNPDAYTPYNHDYQEEGYSASDAVDGDLTGSVVVTNDGSDVKYTVRNSAGNYAVAVRKIIYDDRSAPVLSFGDGSDENDVTVFVGSSYDPAVTALDDSEDDVTDRIETDGSVDTSTPGDYSVTYSVSDSYGHNTSVTRVVHVIPLPQNHSGAEDSKTIYLTFDDGPSGNTSRLLDILDKYHVKATFFTTGRGDDALIGEEYRRGHTVAVHTETHNYAQIYASTDAYWADFNRQNARVYAQTGSYTSLMRFPGGSSNTVSANYCSGIMTILTQQASAKGLHYFDWNVSSGDAGNIDSADQVFDNITNGISSVSAKGYPSVVLQHDTKSFSVDAVSRVIEWGLANGYHFEKLGDNSFTAHHHINN
ncbi:polysaccharide deacetylase family protein [Lactimicrobium sp.]